MIEKKSNLITDKYTYTFGRPLEIEVDDSSYQPSYSVKQLSIHSNNIYNLSMAFEELYITLNDRVNFTEPQLKWKQYLDSLEITQEKIVKKKKKKKINSRAKGKRGENLAITALGEHFGELKIYKTPGSGSLGTIYGIQVTEGIDLCGDLFAVPDGSEEYKRFNKFSYEVKNYASLPDILGEITYKKSGDLKDWIEQNELDRSRNNKEFCIIFKASYSPLFTILREEYVKNRDFKDKYIMRFRYKDAEYFIFNLKEVRFE